MKPRLTILLLAGGVLGWLFFPALSGRASFAFRDAAHFYHPFFEYIRDEWRAGQAPLWNPYENLGGPIVAENTSSVFYPAKLLFLLPLDYTWLYNLYIVSHVGLAVATAYLLARRLQASPFAAALAGLSYAFSGSVLFQYCNVVFLVGASWLPAAMLFADHMLRGRSLGGAVGLGAVLALMVTGGDPQMAYQAALLSVLYAVVLWLADRRAVETTDSPPIVPPVQRRPVLLGIAALISAGLAAVQLFPTLEAGPYSERGRYDAPRNLYEVARHVVTPAGAQDRHTWYEGLLSADHAGHHARIYEFSIAPPAFLDLLWPNVTGPAFPTDARWLRILGVEGRVWVPSLYLGLAPLLLAFSAWSIRRAASLDVRFWSWVALVTAVGSFGMYGIGYVARHTLGSAIPGIGDETGGIYWLLVVVLPYYVQFRYPAKLFVITSLALAILAARGWDAYWLEGRRRVLGWFAAVPPLTALALWLVIDNWRRIETYNRRAQYSEWLGPFDWPAAWSAIAWGLGHAAVLAILLLGCFWIGRKQPRFAVWMQTLALALTALDLALAQQPLIGYAPAESWTATPKIVGTLTGKLNGDRVYRQPAGNPESWRKKSSPERYTEWLEWDRATLAPKYPLPYHISLAEAPQTVAGADYQMVLDVARVQNRRLHQRESPEPSVLDLVATRFALVEPFSRRQLASSEPIAEGIFLGERAGALPRCWIVHDVEAIPPINSRNLRAIRRATQQILFPDNQPRDWRHTAVVETDSPPKLAPPPEAPSGETCRIVRDEPGHVEIEATLATEGLIVLSDQFYPGWTLAVETAGESGDAEILRTNRVMRGALLPAGKHRLIYRYRPRSVLFGGLISAVSIAAVAFWRVRRFVAGTRRVP